MAAKEEAHLWRRPRSVACVDSSSYYILDNLVDFIFLILAEMVVVVPTFDFDIVVYRN